MTQDHVLLIFMFPEYTEEYFMTYTSDELDVAKVDAEAFHQMYEEVLYVAVLFVYQDGREEELFRWSNPRTDRLLKAANSAGGVGLSGYPMTLGSAPTVGTSSPMSSSRSTSYKPGARPPSVAAYESPSATASKSYSGRGARTLRSRGKRR